VRLSDADKHVIEQSRRCSRSPVEFAGAPSPIFLAVRTLSQYSAPVHLTRRANSAPWVSLHYGDHVHWATIITSTGALLGGLAIVIAFIQLGNQREDRLRGQVSKIGVWTQADDARMVPDQPEWLITLFIQNASELPVEVHMAELAIDTLGYQNVLASADGEPPQQYADKRTRPAKAGYFFPGTIPPGHKWHGKQKYTPDGDFDTIVRPRISIIKLAITDAAGRQWDMRPYRGRPPRRVRWRHEWPWRRGRPSAPGTDKK
jgi:hypothetical protein